MQVNLGQLPGDQSSSWEAARESYSQVLDAHKHLDDKVARFVVAIAFLATAAGAIVARDTSLATRIEVGGQQLPLAAVSLGAFLVLISLSVSMFMMALGPHLAFPGELLGLSKAPHPDSLLFFASIQRRSLEKWREEWASGPQEIRDRVISNFIDEAHFLARHTYFKYRRMSEARAAFSAALPFLALGIIFHVAAGTASVPVQLSAGLRWLATIIVGLFTFLAASEYLRLEATVPSDGSRIIRGALWTFAASGALFSGLLIHIVGRPFQGWQLVVVGPILIAVGLQFLFAREGWKNVLTFSSLGLAVVASLGLAGSVRWVQLLAPLGPILLLSLLRFRLPSSMSS